MKVKRLVVVFLLGAFLSSLFGCKKDHILDGPGMVNDSPWKAFTVSRTDSYSQYNFWFTVEQGDFGFLLTGECRGADGELYTIEEGVELSTKDVLYLRGLHLGDLEDVTPDNEAGDEELILPDALDAPDVTLHLTWRDGKIQEKGLSQDISIEMYNHFLPYFENN